MGSRNLSLLHSVSLIRCRVQISGVKCGSKTRPDAKESIDTAKETREMFHPLENGGVLTPGRGCSLST
jgi:hypothetical protein